MNELPIDVVPGTNPPRFTWKQTVNAIDGKRVIDNNGMLAAGVDFAVQRLINMHKVNVVECDRLRKENAELRGKMMEQSNLLHKEDKNVPQKVKKS
jgi:hypothetical protein